MRQNFRFVLAGMALVIIPLLVTGCMAIQASLYPNPIEGPLAQSGITKINAEFTWDGTGHGTITIIMPDGEICTGEYTTVAGGGISFGSGTLFTQSQYLNYFGNSINVPNSQYGQAIATGNKGTVIQAEYYVSGLSNHGYGLAKDNKGNIYKILF